MDSHLVNGGDFLEGRIRVDDVHLIAKAMGLPTRSVVESLIGGIEYVPEAHLDGIGKDLGCIKG